MMRNIFFTLINVLILFIDSFLDIKNEITEFVNTFLGVPFVYAPIYSFGVLADYKAYQELIFKEMYFVIIPKPRSDLQS